MDERTVPYLSAAAVRQQAEQSQNRTWGNDFQYRALFEQSGDCIFIISLDLCYMAANPQAYQLLGYTEAELVGMPVSRVMAMDESSGQGKLQEQASSLEERILRRKDGTVVPVEINTSIVYHETGAPAYIQSIVRDISRRKQVEQDLHRHNEIMAAISNATTTLLQSTDVEKNMPGFLESLGKAAGAVAGFIFKIKTTGSLKTLIVLYEWQRGGSFRLEIADSLASRLGAIQNNQASLYAENVTIAPARSLVIAPIIGKTGTNEYLGFFHPGDVETWLPAQRQAIQIAANLIGAAWQRNQYEETLLASEARNRTIIEALPDLIIRLGANGKILDYNVIDSDPLFRPHADVAGKLLSEIWPEEIANLIMGGNGAGSFLQPHYMREFKLPFSSQTYESRLTPITQSEALLIVRDITEQARLNEMKSDFINRASHELRMPLTNAILMTNLIQEGGTAQEQAEYWKILTSELDRQKVLIERLLVAGRLESRALKLEIAPIDLAAILDESIQAVKLFANKKNISIPVKFPNQPIIIQGDKSGLQQVFINLINNAVKFSPEGSSVEVDVQVDDNEARVSISDHGMGIPAEDIPHLCERFFRGRNVTIAEVPGSGIGLYIVKSIVEELGGKIMVESVLKQGTTMSVILIRSKTLPAE